MGGGAFFTLKLALNNEAAIKYNLYMDNFYFFMV